MSDVALDAYKKLNIQNRAQSLVLWALCDRHQTETGQCFPSYKTLCEMTGLCRRTVIYAVNALVRAGLIRKRHAWRPVRKRRNRYHSQTSNAYEFLFFTLPDRLIKWAKVAQIIVRRYVKMHPLTRNRTNSSTEDSMSTVFSEKVDQVIGNFTQAVQMFREKRREPPPPPPEPEEAGPYKKGARYSVTDDSEWREIFELSGLTLEEFQAARNRRR
ncbi:MAG: helix-turn-helix domain-containing protein [Alphaproteobacteria bacterium]